MKDIEELNNKIIYDKLFNKILNYPFSKYFEFEKLDITDKNIYTVWKIKTNNSVDDIIYGYNYCYIGKLTEYNEFYFLGGSFQNKDLYNIKLLVINLPNKNLELYLNLTNLFINVYCLIPDACEKTSLNNADLHPAKLYSLTESKPTLKNFVTNFDHFLNNNCSHMDF